MVAWEFTKKNTAETIEKVKPYAEKAVEATKEAAANVAVAVNETAVKAQECKQLQALPEGIGQLRSLQHLNLAGCEQLHVLPESIGQLSLVHLCLPRHLL